MEALPTRNMFEEMDARDGKSKCAGVAEAAYRRGFQHGLLAVKIVQQRDGSDSYYLSAPGVEDAIELAGKLRSKHRRIPWYLEFFIRKLIGDPKISGMQSVENRSEK